MGRVGWDILTNATFFYAETEDGGKGWFYFVPSLKSPMREMIAPKKLNTIQSLGGKLELFCLMGAFQSIR